MEISCKRLWKMMIDMNMKKNDPSVVAEISRPSVAGLSRGEPENLEIILKT